MVNGVLSRKVEITLNSAVSLVQTVQPNFLYFLMNRKGSNFYCL